MGYEGKFDQAWQYMGLTRGGPLILHVGEHVGVFLPAIDAKHGVIPY
jgi:hypothetical protein